VGPQGGKEEGTCEEVSTLLSASGVKQDPDKVKLESRVMGDYSARFGEHNYDHFSSAEA
jgi:hypothetical protein